MTARPPSPFDYTTRDYAGIRDTMFRQLKARIPGWTGYDPEENESDPTDFVVALVESVSYAADSMHYYLDRIANEAYIATAMRPESIMSMARLVGYRPSRGTSASVELMFTNGNGERVVIPPGTRVQTSVESEWDFRNDDGPWESDPLPIVFETIEELALEPFMPGTVPAREGITFRGTDGTGEVLGVSNGYAWQSFTIPHSPVSDNSVQVKVQFGDSWDSEWTKVEDIRSAPSSSSVFQMVASPSGPVRLLFGNEQSGGIPPRGAVVKATYKVGGGQRGNVRAGSLTVITDDISLVGVTVTNPAPAAGGTDDEPLESVRNKIVWRGVRTPDRATSLADYERIALSSEGVGKARAYAPTLGDVSVAVGPLDDATGMPGMISQIGVADPLLPGRYLPDDANLDWADDTTLDASMTAAGYAPLLKADGSGPVGPWDADAYSTIGDRNVRWNGAWEEVSGQPLVPKTVLSEDFVKGVLPTVRRTLEAAGAAGTQIMVKEIEYVSIWPKVRIIYQGEATQSLSRAAAQRMRQMFSYTNTSFEQRISQYDLMYAMSSGRFAGVEVIGLSITDQFSRPSGNLVLEDYVQLAPWQVPALPAWINDDHLVEVVVDDTAVREAHLLNRSGVPGPRVTGTTYHTGTRRSR